MAISNVAASAKVSITQIFEFTSHFIENIHFRSNGRLLLSSLSSGDLFTIDPASPPLTAKAVVNCPGSTGLSGLATIGPDLYAVSGGIHGSFRFDDMKVYVVSIPGDSDSGTLLDSISVPDTYGLNGMAALPRMPRVVLSADSHGSCIYRINTLTRKVDVAIADPLLGHGPVFKLGINGLKIFSDYLYFTNSGQGFFARVKINDDGSKAGDIEIVARIPGGAPDMSHAYDDFTLDFDGNAYVTLHTNEIMKITQDGIQTTFAGGGDSTTFKSPTSAATSLDGKSIYVATAGLTPGVGEMVFHGQVIQISI
ncbi:uncharacterized protein PAC_10007 [Phialocephala subalpina]|uniref:SMP-30/Gluconolactonase/LRE-like region domain-containing protein n=1 Tax=Phialocephala subalpina TaxID=576137 RepID=A0A1L7X514_9HELO|nr:uncharacterized protein PAC_10007 [Phialocephala subalpina]